MAKAIEIRLSLHPEHASRLWRVLGRRPHARPTTRRLFSVYYDTPDCRLHRAGMALRLRREGSHWIQAVITDPIAGAALHRRVDHEVQVAAQFPSFPAMVAAGLGKLVSDRRTRKMLQVAFTTDFRRSATLIGRRAGTAVEVSLDRGTITAGGRSIPVCEIELALKTGDLAALFDLADEIAHGMPVRLEHRSKAERGYALAAGIETLPVKASVPPISAAMTVDDAFVAIARHCLSHLQDNEIGLRDGRSPECLHQARVALRRLCTAFRIFGGAIPGSHFADPLQELKSFARLLGDARDLDVFSCETFPQVEYGGHEGLTALHQRVQSARTRAASAVRTAIATPEYTVMLLRFEQALATVPWRQQAPRVRAAQMTVLQFATKHVSHWHTRIRKSKRPVSQLGFAELHRLRVRLRRLRYAVEFFMPIFEDKAHAILSALIDLQEALGRFNDVATAWQLLDAFGTEDPSPDYQQAVGFARGWCARDAEQCRNRVHKAWKRFDALRPWWTSSG